MPVTTIDPKTALIIVDLQKGIASFPTFNPIAEAVKNASSLASAFRHHGLPVVLVNVTGAAPGRAEQCTTPAYFRRTGQNFCRSSVDNLRIMS